MALFGKKKDEAAVAEQKEGTTQEVAPKADTTPAVQYKNTTANVILAPRITEKATIGTAPNVYVFNVASTATKQQVKAAVKAAYNVEPQKVHVTQIMKKNVRSMRTGAKGVKQGGKKAYVYLKKGDKISLM